MKTAKYTPSMMIGCLCLLGITACTKTPDNKPDDVVYYAFRGTTKGSLDSQYIVDPATQELDRLYIDSSYTDAVEVSVDKEYINFTFHSGTFTNRVLDALSYSFPVQGPYAYATHSSPGTSYRFTLVGEDSLYFDYYSVMISNGFLARSVKFAGKRTE